MRFCASIYSHMPWEEGGEIAYFISQCIFCKTPAAKQWLLVDIGQRLQFCSSSSIGAFKICFPVLLPSLLAPPRRSFLKQLCQAETKVQYAQEGITTWGRMWQKVISKVLLSIFTHFFLYSQKDQPNQGSHKYSLTKTNFTARNVAYM